MSDQTDVEQRQEALMAAELRLCAALMPEPLLGGHVNLGSWVGIDTPAWHTVFSYSSPDPHGVWFCSLDSLAQSLVLLLVAERLETQQ